MIPVVFHVLHLGGMENISDAQIMDAMGILNEDFNMAAGDTLGVYPGNTVVTADMEVRFCLATIDPQGQPTTGIERIETPLTDQGLDPAAKIDPWPRDRYLNIWVVRGAGNTAGYTLMPEEAHPLPEQDGIVIRHEYVGGIGTGNLARSRTLTHEAGHFLGLHHPWDIPTGFGTCGDDLVDDTPVTTPDVGWCTLPSQSVCAPPTEEVLPNFMVFSYCMRMFTEGQKARVQGFLNGSIAERDNLWTPENIAATGACLPTGIGEAGMAGPLRVHPHPFTGEVWVSGRMQGMVQVTVMDARGAIELQEIVGAGSQEGFALDLSRITAPGLHLLRITDGIGSRTVRLIRE